MKFITCLCAYLCFSSSVFAAEALDIALEPQSIKVEYMPSSNRGIIYVKGCEQCDKPYYSFKQQPEIIKQNKVISFENFMTDYWNAKFPTLFLDMQTHAVMRVTY